VRRLPGRRAGDRSTDLLEDEERAGRRGRRIQIQERVDCRIGEVPEELRLPEEAVAARKGRVSRALQLDVGDWTNAVLKRRERAAQWLERALALREGAGVERRYGDGAVAARQRH